MKRTANDFAADARDEDVYELILADGTTIEPRSTHDFSYDELVEQEANSGRWYRWHQANPGKQAPDGAKIDDIVIYSPDEWSFRARFGHHYEAWFAEWRKHPRRYITQLLAEVDSFYDPTAASERELERMRSGDADTAGKSGGAAT